MNFIDKMVERFIKLNRRMKRWQRVVSVMAAVVVFATTYALILPAITLDRDTATAEPGIEVAASENEAGEAGTVFENTKEPASEETADEPEEAVAEDSGSESGSQEAEAAQAEAVAEENTSEVAPEENTSEVAPADENEQKEVLTTEEAATYGTTEEAIAAVTGQTTEDVKLITEDTQLTYDGSDYVVYADFGESAKLPEGVQLQVKEITKESDPEAYEMYYEKALSEMQGKYDENITLSFARFYDIAFVYKGVEIEPSGNVNVRIEYKQAVEIEKTTTVDTIHFDKNDEEKAEVIDSDTEGTEKEVEAVQFESDRFSVYGIIGTGSEDEPWVLTVNMFAPSVDGDHKFTGYEAYSYQDENGNLVGTQYVENNGTIMDPGTPSIRVDGCVFKGWYYGEKNGESITWGDKVDFESTVSLTNNAEKDIYARYDTAYYVTFYDSNESTIVKTKTADLDANGKYTVTINDVTVIPDNSEMAFRGWSYDKKEVAGRTLIEGDSIEVTGNTKLYPVFVNCKVLTFSENQPAGGGASYTPPEVVFEDGVTTRPTDPHRAGYTFGGWFTEGDGDGGVSGEEFVFGNPLPENKTIYAKWIPSDAKYTVIFWKQKVSDDKDAADADKHYDYESSEQRASSTGTLVSITNADKNKNYQGFKYNSNNSDEETVEVKADGSTILNVYYDRELITINFTTPGSSYWDPDTTETFTGLYEQSLSQNGYTWPEAVWRLDNYDLYIEYLGSFIPPSSTTISYSTTVNLTKVSSNNTCRFYFYKQNVDGTYNNQPDATSRSIKFDRWLPDELFNGFEATAYRTSTSGSWNSVSSSQPNWVTFRNSPSNMYVRYARKSYNIEFKNVDGGSIKAFSKKYEESLNGIETEVGTPDFPGDPSDKNKYSFVGWFADPECTTYVSFKELTDAEKQRLTEDWGIQSFTTYDQMPANNLVVYAGWYKNWYMVALNPNGGELPHPDGEYQAGAFYVQYGNLIGGSSLMQTTMEDYDLVGWTISTVDGEVITARDPERQNKRFVTDFSNWTAGTEFWNFDTQVEGPLQLTAMWKYKKAMYIEYDPDGGTLQEEDEKVYPYADQSQARAVAAPVAPAGKVFAGWQIVVREDGTDTPIEGLILPGETFDINAHDQSSKDKDGNLYIQLKAVYTDIDTTVITYHRNFNDADTTVQVINDVSVNNNIIKEASKPILPEDTFTRPGYRFVVWNTKKDGSGKSFKPGDTKYAVDLNKGNDLYAIWEKLYFDLEFMKKGEQVTGEVTALAGASFGLYSDPDCKTPVKDKDGQDFAVVTTADDGVVKFTQIPAPSTEGGVYYVKETVQPDGYEVNSTIYTVTYKKTEEGNYIGVLKDGDTEVTEINNTLIKSDLNILKSNTSGDKLTGAVFNLTRNENEDGTGKWIDIKKLGDFEIKETTGFLIKNLPNGLYRLTEVKAPDGYIIIKDPVQFKIINGSITIVAGTDVAASTNATSEKTAEIDVKNSAGTPLPMTGGPGTILYTLGGLMLILASAMMYGFRMRRGERRIK